MKTAKDNVRSSLEHFALALACLAEADAKRIGNNNHVIASRVEYAKRREHLLRIAQGIDRVALLMECDEI